MVLTLLHLYRAGCFARSKVTRATATFNAHLETSDEKAKSEASDEKETESRLETVDD